MKLKPVIKKELKKEVEQQKAETPKKNKKDNKLPPDVYKPMFEPIRILVRETPSTKDITKMVRQYIELSVKRFDDDAAQPFVWIQMYQESDFYTGYLKGKTVHFPLEMLFDIMDGLNDLCEECDRRHIEQCDDNKKEGIPKGVLSVFMPKRKETPYIHKQ